MTRDGVIDRFKFLCPEDHCLTKVLHYVEREDVVRPAPLGEIPIAEVPSSQPPYGHHDPDMASAPPVWSGSAATEAAADPHPVADDHTFATSQAGEARG